MTLLNLDSRNLLVLELDFLLSFGEESITLYFSFIVILFCFGDSFNILG